jgi:hypothetical protein
MKGRSQTSAETYRANPGFRILKLEELSAEAQELLGPLRKDPSFYGLICSQTGDGEPSLAVCSQTAKLIDTLATPGLLPRDILDDPEALLAVNRLVFDGILQVARGAEWLCGPAVCPTDSALKRARGLLARLSLEAIQHAASLEAADAMELATCLYRYNTMPVTPQWLRRLPDTAAGVEEYLQIAKGGCQRKVLDQNWICVTTPAKETPWLMWSSRRTVPGSGASGYKLYLSPHPSHLRDAFQVWLPAITDAGAYHFKVGGNVRGLLRPDKIVAYFAEHNSLMEASRLIANGLLGCPAQGVPFASDLNCGALVSWGSDPPFDETVPVWMQRQSWRQWICRRLGSALARAKRQNSEIPAWRFALERLRLDGIDVEFWTPTSTPWFAANAEVTTL